MGTPWEPHGNPMGSTWVPWGVMAPHGSPWGFHRDPMGSHGVPMGPHGDPMGPYGTSWVPHGVPQGPWKPSGTFSIYVGTLIKLPRVFRVNSLASSLFFISFLHRFVICFSSFCCNVLFLLPLLRFTCEAEPKRTKTNKKQNLFLFLFVFVFLVFLVLFFFLGGVA